MSSGQITALLKLASADEASHLDQIYHLLYHDIKRIAAYQLNQMHGNETLSPTVLAHECYIKIARQQNLQHNDRQHFLNYLAKAMRRFLLDHIRNKNRDKRKGQFDNRQLSQVLGATGVSFDLFTIDECIEQLSQVDKHLSQIFQQKLLFEFTFKELAEIHSLSERQVIRKWNHAKTLILTLLESHNGAE